MSTADTKHETTVSTPADDGRRSRSEGGYHGETLGDALPKEMARIRDEVIPAYQEIGAAGYFALTFMRRDLDLAARSMAEGDVVAMIRSLQTLRDYKL